MAKIKPEKANEKIVISQFGGIRQTSSMKGDSASMMRNFRISSDGSLEKRTGTKTLFQVEEQIRGLWQGSLNGRDYLIVVAGSAVYLRLPGESELTFCHRLNSNSGRVSFAVYHGLLYLFDGNSIYRFSPAFNNFYTAYGYTPLYGNAWDPVRMGEINEPLNALATRVRISYDNSSGSTTFALPFGMQSIIRVEVDGVAITPDAYTAGALSFSIPQQYAYGTLTAAFNLRAAQDHRSMVYPMSASFLFSKAGQSTLLLYGGGQNNQMTYTAPVTDEMVAQSNHFFPNNEDALYFPLDHFFSLADAAHPICAVFRDRDRVIALNDRSAWALTFSGDRLLSYPLEGGTGCSAPGGFVLCGDHPVVVQNGGIFRLRFPSGESDVCIAESLSQEVIELLPASIFQNGILAWFPGRDELWLRDPTETEEGLVWVYKRQKKEWYCFNNLYITGFFDLEGTVGFGTADGKILLPDETSYADSGSPVTAIYRSQYIAFSFPENRKRAIRVTACADTGGQRLLIAAETDARTNIVAVQSQLPATPELFDFNMSLGRFRFVRFQFQISGSSPARIYRFSTLVNL